MMPTFWQMQRGERAVTITVHRMADSLDTGDVLATQVFAFRNRDSLDRVIKGTKCEGARLLIAYSATFGRTGYGQGLST